MRELIVTPFLGHSLVLRPGSQGALRVPASKYHELARASAAGEACPPWLAEAARRQWQRDIAAIPLADLAIIRPETPCRYLRATYELNLGCNYDCEHCYLGPKRFAGLTWPQRYRLLHILADAGVIWLQLTGGEPTLDPLFPRVYALARELGMMLTILTNGSRLASPALLDLLTAHPPQDITISVYGATEATYDRVTRRRGAFRAFTRGLQAAHEAGMPLTLSLIITSANAHEASQMQDMAGNLGVSYHQYANISPTIHGGPETLPAQSGAYQEPRAFTGCDAGRSFFHVDPHGMASICKIGRHPAIPLLDEGTAGLRRLPAIAGSLLARKDSCADCALQQTCATCMPRAQLYRTARAPLAGLLPATRTRKGGDSMTASTATSAPPEDALADVEFIEDLDTLIASARCSCQADDHSPY